MKRLLPEILFLATSLIFCFGIQYPDSDSCSTFLISDQDVLLVGHNLDGPRWRWKQEPGSVFINKRASSKRSVSGFELGAASEQKVTYWSSKYASATFNGFGRELPDGGMNERGLAVNEMGFGYLDYTYNDSLPSMMAAQWIQYQLDNYATVGEVIGNLNSINILPWGLPAPIGGNNWHFFISDSTGNHAIIEFEKGRSKVYTEKSAPVPVLCNRSYVSEIENIRRFMGFGGKKKIILKPKIISYWFNQGARMVNDFDADKCEDPVAYAFSILRTMQRPLSEQWSIVYDIRNLKIYYRSHFSGNIKYFELSSFDPKSETVRVLPDMHQNYEGDVTQYFVPYSYELNCELVERSLTGFLKAFKKLYSFEGTGSSPEQYKNRRKKIVNTILSTDRIVDQDIILGFK